MRSYAEFVIQSEQARCVKLCQILCSVVVREGKREAIAKGCNEVAFEEKHAETLKEIDTMSEKEADLVVRASIGVGDSMRNEYEKNWAAKQ